MYFYFKDNTNGVGMTTNTDTFVGQVEWITKEEYEAIIAATLQQEVQANGID